MWSKVSDAIWSSTPNDWTMKPIQQTVGSDIYSCSVYLFLWSSWLYSEQKAFNGVWLTCNVDLMSVYIYGQYGPGSWEALHSLREELDRNVVQPERQEEFLQLDV